MSHGKILIKGATIIDAQSPYNGKVADILIENNIILEIGDIEPSDYEMVDASGKYVSIGWMDMRVNFCDPGDEHKETIESGCNAARAGGFTAVAVMPNLQPVTDHKSQIEYIQNRGEDSGLKVFAVGAMSANCEGKELAELYDMHCAGAIAFADAGIPVSKSGLLLRALQYCQTFGSRVMVHCEDKSLSSGGSMHEGPVSVSLGLKGIPALAESVSIARDIEILRYTGGKMHISRVSTLQGVSLIRSAKAEGLDVTADVTIHHLLLSDESLKDFDTNFKMNPPLRSQEHILALIDGVNDGTIDCIVSDHTPENIENKAVEFEYAHAGVIGTQLLFSLYQTYLSSQILLEKFISCIAVNPRKILNIPIPKIELEEPVQLTVFCTETLYKFDQRANKSASNNSPFMGRELKGKALITFCN